MPALEDVSTVLHMLKMLHMQVVVARLATRGVSKTTAHLLQFLLVQFDPLRLIDWLLLLRFLVVTLKEISHTKDSFLHLQIYSLAQEFEIVRLSLVHTITCPYRIAGYTVQLIQQSF